MKRSEAPRSSPGFGPRRLRSAAWRSRHSVMQLSGQPAGFWQKCATAQRAMQQTRTCHTAATVGFVAGLAAAAWLAARVEAPA